MAVLHVLYFLFLRSRHTDPRPCRLLPGDPALGLRSSIPLSSVSENRCGDDGGSDDAVCGELRSQIPGVEGVVDGERGRFALRRTVGDDCIVRLHCRVCRRRGYR